MQHEFEFVQNLQARPKFPERLFFALLPDAETASCIDRFRQRFFCDNGLLGRPLDVGRLHLSLHHIGDYKRLRSKYVFAASCAGQSVAMRRIEVTFRSVLSFEGAPQTGRGSRAKPLVMLGEGDALFELHAALRTAMRKNGLRAADTFTPHMTLSYDRQRIPLQPIDPIQFVASGFTLIHSERWLSRYHFLGSWPLSA